MGQANNGSHKYMHIMHSVKYIFENMSFEHRPTESPIFDHHTINVNSKSTEKHSSWIEDKNKIFDTFQKMVEIMDAKGCPGSQYFDYYSNLLTFVDTSLIESQESNAQQILLIFDHFSFTLASAIVAPALASGNSVIVKADEMEVLYFIKLLKYAGVPNDAVQRTTEPPERVLREINLSKLIYIGDKTSFQSILGPEFDAHCSLTHLVPQQTGALLLETCDMEAAVDNIIISTWAPSDLNGFFGVSTVVVQQVVFRKFLKELKSQLRKFSQDFGHSKFCLDESMIEKMKNLVVTAQMNGIEVITNDNIMHVDKWSPTVLLNNNRKLPSFCGIINVLTCRTPKEGIQLLNDHSIETGISVWTENPALAMEMASGANCYHVWVNCHACISPSAPIHTSNYVLGGETGFYQYLEEADKTYKSVVDDGDEQNVEDEFKLIESTKKSMKLWQKQKNKIIHLRNFIASTSKSFDWPLNNEVLEKCLTSRAPTPSLNDNNPKHYCVEEILPIGLIAIYVNSVKFEVNKDFLQMVLAVLGRGNGIIVIGEPESKELSDLAAAFKAAYKDVPIGVYLKGMSTNFVRSPHVQDVWKIGNFPNVRDIIDTSKTFSNAYEMATRCYKSKIIWIPKVDQFP